MWIVPGSMCAMRYINDPRYLDEDRTPRNKRDRKANVEFYHGDEALRPTTIVHHTAQEIWASRNIVVGEEFYVDCGSEYVMIN